MLIKTENLDGDALNYAVAVALGHVPVVRPHVNGPGFSVYLNAGMMQAGIPFRPVQEWAQGGPLMQTELIGVEPVWFNMVPGRDGHWRWMAVSLNDDEDMSVSEAFGDTPLTAAMRVLVADRIGAEVDVFFVKTTP